MEKPEFPTGLGGFPGPAISSDEPQTLLKLSFREVYMSLMVFLEHQRICHDLSEEDIKQLFECMLLSYFSRYADTPNQTLKRLLPKASHREDYFKGRNGEIALGITEAICAVVKRHFPNYKQSHLPEFYQNGHHLAERLEISDAYMHGADSVVVHIPKRVFLQLQNEHSSRRPPD